MIEPGDAKRNEAELLPSTTSQSSRLLEKMHPSPHIKEKFLSENDLII